MINRLVRRTLVLLAVALLALALAPPGAAQTSFRLSPHSASTFDPVTGSCTIHSVGDDFAAATPVSDLDPGSQLAGILVTGDDAATDVASVTSPTRATPTHNVKGRDASKRARRKTSLARSTTPPDPTAGSPAPPVICAESAGVLLTDGFARAPDVKALLAADARRYRARAERRERRPVYRHVLHSNTHPEDRADPRADEKPSIAIRI